MERLIEIDGSYGEGGGQVLRTALTLSALTGLSTRIYRIRAGRSNPGLAPQHLTGVNALAELCDADVQGAAIRSVDLVFTPQSRPRAGSYIFDVTRFAKSGSAGSVTLIFQTLLFPLVSTTHTSHLTLKGGTHVPWSPPFDYVTNVFLPTVARMGFKAECRLDAMGFYPKGGGQITADIYPVGDLGSAMKAGTKKPDLLKGSDGNKDSRTISPLILTERGDLQSIRVAAVACNLPSHIARRMANRAHGILRNAGLDADITPKRERGAGPGAGLFMTVEYENCLAGFSALGKRGKSSEQVAEEACRDLLDHHEKGAPVESHLADQLLLPMALAGGRSEFWTSCVSKHLLTNAHIIEKFIPAQIEIDANEGESGNVAVQWVGDF